jgi:hypothetical protein
MSPSEALAAAREAGVTGRFFIVAHALSRQEERSVSRFDLRNALMTAKVARYQPSKDRWRLEGGVDLDEDDLTVVIEIDSGVVVITVF